LRAFTQSMGNPPEAMKLMTDDIEFSDGSTTLQGADQVRSYFETFARAFPDARVRLGDNTMEDGDRASAELTYEGTHTGPLGGPQGDIPATGKAVSLPGSAFITLRDGKIASFHGYYDQMAMMSQLGLMPGS
jgi:steroid delta-isomerase-like uncharacterized protein